MNSSLNENSIPEYSEFTTKITSELHNRSKNGQYFSSYSQVRKCLKLLEEVDVDLCNTRILEPSAGTGQFADILKKEAKGSELVLVEKDPILSEGLIKRFSDKKVLKSLTIINMDFLLFSPTKKFDIIIGNPPYVELSEYDKTEYKSSLSKGRYNIFGYFLEHSINLLNPNGVLIFILPTSLMTAPSFSKIRKFIKEECNILNIEALDNFSKEVSQEVNIYLFKKVPEAELNRLFTKNIGQLIFTIESKEDDEQDYILLSNIAKVVTGSIVWNTVKGNLHDDYEEGRCRLIYSNDVGNIDSGKITVHKIKKAYIETSKPSVKLPAIFITRGKKLRHELVLESDIPLIGENHVNVIHGDIKNLRLINEYLRSVRCKEYIKQNATTLNFSKTQLDNLPIYEEAI